MMTLQSCKKSVKPACMMTESSVGGIWALQGIVFKDWDGQRRLNYDWGDDFPRGIALSAEA